MKKHIGITIKRVCAELDGSTKEFSQLTNDWHYIECSKLREKKVISHVRTRVSADSILKNERGNEVPREPIICTSYRTHRRGADGQRERRMIEMRFQPSLS